jgi:hypothetical protein
LKLSSVRLRRVWGAAENRSSYLNCPAQMKSFILTAALIAIVIGFLVVTFREELRLQVLNYFIKITATNSIVPATEPSPLASIPSNTNNSSQTQKFVPPRFKGPTGEPRVIGPNGNPPNY